jgi:hypothetical protein
MDTLNNLLDSNAQGVLVKTSNTNSLDARELEVLSIKGKIAEMNTALLASNPLMPVLLREIHQHLRKDPELVTIITEEEIGMIVNGLKKQTNTVLATTTIKQSTSKAEKVKQAKLTLDDI